MIKNSWSNLVIHRHDNIQQALEIINTQDQRIAFVLDHHGCLVGSVTDGDIRRGLLKGMTLDTSVIRVMNSTPKFVDKGFDNKAVNKMMEREHIHCLPVVENDKVISVINRRKHTRSEVKNPVFMMAGGFGKRLRPLTNDCPKPLLKVGGTPILEIILERFVEAGFGQFFISTHYMSEMFYEHFRNGEKWGVDIQYVRESEPLGTAGALGLIHSDIELPMVVINGDVLTGVDFRELLDAHAQGDGVATVCVSEYEYEIPYGVINCQGSRVDSLEEKPKHKVNVNSGIYVLDPKVVNRLQKNVALDMPDVLKYEMSQGNIVNTFPIFEYWMDIGRKEDYEHAQTRSLAEMNPMSVATLR